MALLLVIYLSSDAEEKPLVYVARNRVDELRREVRVPSVSWQSRIRKAIVSIEKRTITEYETPSSQYQSVKIPLTDN